MSPSASPPTDASDVPLRADVRLLGAMLGDVLRDQGGAALFDRVESARLAARSRRAGDATAAGALTALRGLPEADAASTAGAFSAYFSLINLAERIHRIRRRREHAMEGTAPGSLADVCARLEAAGASRDALRETLERLEIRPVFTAHPTEAVRPALLAKEQRIARALVERMTAGSLTPDENAALLGRIRDEVTAAWQTREHLAQRPSVSDEVENLLFVLVRVVCRIVPHVLEQLEAAAGSAPPSLLRFGSWIGGDMDGHPHVGPDTMRATLRRHRELIARCYAGELRELSRRLTQSPERAAIAPAVMALIDEAREAVPEAFARIPDRHRDMPYTVLMRLAAARVEATAAGEPGGFASPEDLLALVRTVETSLLAGRGHHAGAFAVRRLRRRVETFGFHLAALDIRQDAENWREAAGRQLADATFVERPAPERARLLAAALDAGGAARSEATASDEAIETFRALKDLRAAHGPDAIGLVIVSMTQGPDDLLAPILLAQRAGLADERGAIPLDFCPLFETVPDLEAARATFEALVDDPGYRRHVTQRGGRQAVMIGYSDSSKESGLLASRWALWRAQEQLAESASARGLTLAVFHGRGGSISRGGTRPRRAILAEPPAALAGRLRVTEQGEIITAKYGLRGIAERTLELVTGATLEAALRPAPAPDPRWREIMESVSAGGRGAWRSLVVDDPEFMAYFRAATPIDVIERLAIGSRPSRRRAGGDITSLRAIPWVFSWTQSRHLLPGWYGAGSALQSAADAHGLSTLREMLAGWPFFETLIADIEMVLAKSDLDIARLYAPLAGAPAERIFPILQAEFDRTRQVICAIREQAELLDGEPVLQRSIRLRNPYVDPLNFLQADLLPRWREAGRPEGPLLDALFTTVKGIARGMHNTG